MKLKFSQFDDEAFDPTEGQDDAAAWEEEQLAQEDARDFRDAHSENPLHVTVYWVERLYGGPEEGGWWYDRYDIAVKTEGGDEELSFPVSNRKEAEKLKTELQIKYPFETNELDSVNGEGTHEVMIEDYKGEFATKNTPHYE